MCIRDRSIDMLNDFKDIEDPSDDVRKDFVEDYEPIKAKMDEIEKKCKGYLAV